MGLGIRVRVRCAGKNFRNIRRSCEGEAGPMLCITSTRPGRTRAGSSRSRWLVVMKRMRSCGVRVGVRVRVRVGIRLRLTVTAKEAARLPRRHAIQRVE